MARPDCIELFREPPIPILYEDRSVMAIDKPPGWMLVPYSWQKTNRNLQAAIQSSIAAGHHWARSRQLKFLKHIHRLDADTSGVLLFAKSAGALHTFGDLFETRKMEKIYLAVTAHAPKESAWTSRQSLAPDPQQIGRMRVADDGKESETAFRVTASAAGKHLIEARPFTGRTHQIRVHLAASGCAIIGDELYGSADKHSLALRAMGLAYRDPFTHREVGIRASAKEFLAAHGFGNDTFRLEFRSLSPRPARPHPTAAIPDNVRNPATPAPGRRPLPPTATGQAR